MSDKINFQVLQSLADGIRYEVRLGFQAVHLSGNLMNTMARVDDKANNEAALLIPAVRYDMQEYIRKKILVSTPWLGSYAAELDEMGSKWHHHKGFVDEAIRKALPLWLRKNGFELVSIAEE